MWPENLPELLEAERRGGTGGGLEELSILGGKWG